MIDPANRSWSTSGMAISVIACSWLFTSAEIVRPMAMSAKLQSTTTETTCAVALLCRGRKANARVARREAEVSRRQIDCEFTLAWDEPRHSGSDIPHLLHCPRCGRNNAAAGAKDHGCSWSARAEQEPWPRPSRCRDSSVAVTRRGRRRLPLAEGKRRLDVGSPFPVRVEHVGQRPRAAAHVGEDTGTVGLMANGRYAR